MRYLVVLACSAVLVRGGVLQASHVTAGNGLLIDWRTVLSGEALLVDADAFDVADLFVLLVGNDVALEAARKYLEPF